MGELEVSTEQLCPLLLRQNNFTPTGAENPKWGLQQLQRKVCEGFLGHTRGVDAYPG